MPWSSASWPGEHREPRGKREGGRGREWHRERKRGKERERERVAEREIGVVRVRERGTEACAREWVEGVRGREGQMGYLGNAI